MLCKRGKTFDVPGARRTGDTRPCMSQRSLPLHRAQGVDQHPRELAPQRKFGPLQRVVTTLLIPRCFRLYSSIASRVWTVSCTMMMPWLSMLCAMWDVLLPGTAPRSQMRSPGCGATMRETSAEVKTGGGQCPFSPCHPPRLALQCRPAPGSPSVLHSAYRYETVQTRASI
jgi:hypothetical protein